MKRTLTTILCALVATGTMSVTGIVRAEDDPAQVQKAKIWKLLKEERPDYYGERETGQDRARERTNYSDVDFESSTLVDEQNDFIADSLEREEISLGLGWPSTPEAVMAKAEPEPELGPEMAAAVEEQISAALRGRDTASKAERQPSAQPEPVSVKEPEQIQAMSDTPKVKPFSSLWKKVNSGDEETVQMSKAEIAQDMPEKIAETDEPVVVLPETEPAYTEDPAVQKARTVQFAQAQADQVKSAEDKILQEIMEDVGDSSDEPVAVETASAAEMPEAEEDVQEKRGFFTGLKAIFVKGERIAATEAHAAGPAEVESDEIAVVADARFQEMRELLHAEETEAARIVKDDELGQIASSVRPTAAPEHEVVYTEEASQAEAESVVMVMPDPEDLPEEILLAKVTDEPLKTLPNPVIIDVKEDAEEKAAEPEVVMNKGIVYQQDIPETEPEQPEPEKVTPPADEQAAMDAAQVKPAEKAVSKKTIKSPKEKGKRTEESMEAEFKALRDSMRTDPASDDTAEAVEDTPMHEPEEDLATKIKRKLSPSGLLKEEVAALDYWEVPVEEQTVEDISRNLKIDQALKEAADIQMTAEEPQPAEVKAKPADKTTVVTAEEIVRKAIPVQNRNKRIDLDFDNTNLSDILLIMGEAGDMNIMLDPALKSNTLDLHLKQITLEDALLLVANSYDLGFKLVGQALFITENEKLRYENKVSRMIKVRNVNVQEAKNLVEDLADNVSISEELNSLMVTGDPKDVAQVEQLVEMLDNPQPQVILEAKIIEVDKNALKDLGVDWSDQINLLYQESGRPQDFDDVENSDSGFYRIAQIQRNPLQFETTIRMLEQQNKAKVLSAPRVSTLNGKQAEIFVGDEVPYTITNITGGVVTNDVRFVEPGIRLTITPSIIEQNFVVMKVEPEVSFIVAFRGPNDEFPQVRTREATAHVRVENKQPFVLKGILNQEDKQSLFKVPFFGDLPLFGNLFSYERNTAVDTELIITVIPTIVHGRE